MTEKLLITEVLDRPAHGNVRSLSIYLTDDGKLKYVYSGDKDVEYMKGEEGFIEGGDVYNLVSKVLSRKEKLLSDNNAHRLSMKLQDIVDKELGTTKTPPDTNRQSKYGVYFVDNVYIPEKTDGGESKKESKEGVPDIIGCGSGFKVLSGDVKSLQQKSAKAIAPPKDTPKTAAVVPVLGEVVDNKLLLKKGDRVVSITITKENKRDIVVVGSEGKKINKFKKSDFENTAGVNRIYKDLTTRIPDLSNEEWDGWLDVHQKELLALEPLTLTIPTEDLPTINSEVVADPIIEVEVTDKEIHCKFGVRTAVVTKEEVQGNTLVLFSVKDSVSGVERLKPIEYQINDLRKKSKLDELKKSESAHIKEFRGDEGQTWFDVFMSKVVDNLGEIDPQNVVCDVPESQETYKECNNVDNILLLTTELLGEKKKTVRPYQFVADNKLHYGFTSNTLQMYTPEGSDKAKRYYPLYVIDSDLNVHVSNYGGILSPPLGEDIRTPYTYPDTTLDESVDFLGHLQKNHDILSLESEENAPDHTQQSSFNYIITLNPAVISTSKWWQNTGNNTLRLTLKSFFETLKNTAKEDLWFSKDVSYDIINTYGFMTYCYELFEHLPYLKFSGATSFGKSRCGFYLWATSFRGLLVTDPSSLHRVIHETGSTLVIDELDFNPRDPNRGKVREALLVGNKRYATVARQEPTIGGHFKTVNYSVFSPKVFATATDFEEMLINRCVEIPMQRKTQRLTRDRDPDISKPPWMSLRPLFRGFALKAAPLISSTFEKYSFPENSLLRNRDQQNFKPLLAIAKVADKELHDNILGFAEDYVRKRLDLKTEDREYGLVFALYELSKNLKDKIELTTDQIEEQYRLQLGDPKTTISGYGSSERVINRRVENEWLNSRWIGRAMNKIGLEHKRPRASAGVKYTFEKTALEEVAIGYQIIDKKTKNLLDFGADSK